MNSITIRVSGLPVGQPRVRAVRRGNRAAVYDLGTANEWKASTLGYWGKVKEVVR